MLVTSIQLKVYTTNIADVKISINHKCNTDVKQSMHQKLKDLSGVPELKDVYRDWGVWRWMNHQGFTLSLISHIQCCLRVAVRDKP